MTLHGKYVNEKKGLQINDLQAFMDKIKDYTSEGDIVIHVVKATR